MILLEKTVGEELALIEALVANEEARIRRAFRQFLDVARSEAVLRQVRMALELRDVEGALQIVDAYVMRLGGVLTQAFQAAGGAEAVSLARSLPRAVAHIALVFDATFPRAAALMRRNLLEFVREFTRSQREATRAALVEAFEVGSGAAETARAFRASIGLTEFQRRAVANYRRLLETGDREALLRILRDRRSDSVVRRAIESGEPLGARQINRMVEGYRVRYLQLRAETIARTEALRTVSLARQEALRQMLEQTGMSSDSVIRIWRATADERTRDTHAAMDRQERGLNVAFDSPSGARLMYPGDPAAPAAEVINCRCVLTHRFRRPVRVS